MRLETVLTLHVRGETVRQDPGFWAKVRRFFGNEPELAGAEERSGLTTAHLVEGTKKALEALGVTNAIALVIDGQVLFEDRGGQADDVDDLFLTFYDNESLYGDGELNDLRLTVEHRDAGVHYVIEISGQAVRARDEATCRVVVAARVSELEPRTGESAEAYEKRVRPLLATPSFAEIHRLHFESFVERVRIGLKDALPEVRVGADEPRAMIVKPGTAAQAVLAGRDNPYARNYPSALPEVAATLMWTALMSWSWRPSYVVVDAGGAEIGTTDKLVGNGAPVVDDFDDGDASDDGGGLASEGDW